MFCPGDSTWYIVGSSSGILSTQFGAAGDVPVPADYDGNGRADIAIFRPSTGEWHVRDTAYTVSVFGFGTDVPVPAAHL